MDSNLGNQMPKIENFKKAQNTKAKPIKNSTRTKKTIHPSFAQNSSLQIHPSLFQKLKIYNVSLLITLANSTGGMQKLNRKSEPPKATRQRRSQLTCLLPILLLALKNLFSFPNIPCYSDTWEFKVIYLELSTSETVNIKAPFAWKGKCCFKVQNIKVLWIHRNYDPWFQKISNAVSLVCLFLRKDYSQGFLVCFCTLDSCPLSRGGA